MHCPLRLLFCSWLFSFLVTDSSLKSLWRLLTGVTHGSFSFPVLPYVPLLPLTVILDCLSPCVTVSSVGVQWDPPSLSFSTLDRTLSVRLGRQKETGVECLSHAREVKLSFLDTTEYGKLSQ